MKLNSQSRPHSLSYPMENGFSRGFLLRLRATIENPYREKARADKNEIFKEFLLFWINSFLS